MGNTLQTETKKIVLFTGHMIDAENRKTPRFPKEREVEIKEKIKETLMRILESETRNAQYIGISGGACGGDILFLEVCKELGLHVKMMLALPAEKFIAESVSFAGGAWVERFYTIYNDVDTEVGIMAADMKPTNLEKRQEGYSFWERNNLWLLDSALAYGGQNVTLIAVWDGKGEDGPGGTRHMIEEAQNNGAESIIIPI